MERDLVRPWQRLVAGKAEVLAQAGRHGPEVRIERSPGGGWSLAEVVEHLVLVERGVGSALAMAPSPDRPRVVAPGRWFRFIALRVALRGGFRFKAPVKAILPTGELPWPDLVARWEDQRRELEDWLRAVDPAVLGCPRFRHPIVGWLTVPQTLTFAADHLEHHLPQIRRLRPAATV